MTVQVFVCHSSRDHMYLAEDSLLGYLGALRMDGGADFWHDELIVAGDSWNAEIQKRISASQIALILVSQWLLNSKYVMNEEVPRFIKRRRDEGMVVFPVILSACEWQQHEWLAQTQFLPRQGKNIESHYHEPGPQTQLFLEILKDLRQQIQRIVGAAQGKERQLVSAVEPTRAPASGEGAPHETEGIWENPFSLVSANDMGPEEIRSLFVGDYTPFQTIKKHFDTMVEGQRGTGKTMVLRYLGLGTQISEWVATTQRPAQQFFDEAMNALGVYCRLDQGVFDKIDVAGIDSDTRKQHLFEHRLSLHCLGCQDGILDTIGMILAIKPPQSGPLRRLQKRLAVILQASEIEQCSDWAEIVSCAKDTIAIRVFEEDSHLGSLTPGGSPTNFNPYLTLSGQVVPFLEFVRSTLGLLCPFFLMLDDFDVLGPSQQRGVFGTASARKLGTVCFKYGIMSLGKKTILAGANRTYREGDDYDGVSLDWTDQGLQGNYRIAAQTIVAKRVESKGWPLQDFASLVTPWQRGREIRQELKQEMLSEWRQLPARDKPKSAENYWSKYGSARYFQKLSSLKTNHRYSGFEEIVDISSGIYRQLLEICAHVVDKALASRWTPRSSAAISAEIQDDAIREYSSAMLGTLSQTAGDATDLLQGEVSVTSKHMVRLIESISSLFHNRLHSDSREPEILCITIKDDLDANPFAKNLLDVAVRESILHRRGMDYTSKTSGGGRLPTYMLNRRLAPRWSLGIRMQGRIEILTSDVVLAATNSTAFMRKVGRIGRRLRGQEGPRLIPLEEAENE